MTLDEELVKAVDRAAKKLNSSRSEFTRHALREALRRMTASEQEERHREGYARNPVRRGEFSAWEAEQSWGDS